jgi:ankyrin repeat protein
VEEPSTGSSQLLPDDIMERIVSNHLDVKSLRAYHQVNREGWEMARNRMDAFEQQVIQPLLRAAKVKDRRLIIVRDPNRRGIDLPLTTTGLTALHLAYRLQNHNALEALRKMGANPNVQDSERRTVLHMAVEDRNLVMLEYFLRDWNADFNVKGSFSNSPFDLAIWDAEREIVELFMRYGAELTASTLEQAIVTNHSEDGVWLMLDLGFDPNTPDPNGRTALHHVYGEYYNFGLDGNSRMVERLQDLITDPNTRDNDGSTALHVMINNGLHGDAVGNLSNLNPLRIVHVHVLSYWVMCTLYFIFSTYYIRPLNTHWELPEEKIE